MCGILGIVGKNLDEKILVRMRDTMIHRGPDDSGIWLSSDRKIGLVHRRLSIIDLTEAGVQPMSDNERKIWISFNGEIYNFQDIRDELKEKGYEFRSRSDTEVIINSYKEWGTDCLHKFNGMFSFGIYDIVRKRIFIARDRLGKKPLYYWHDSANGRFAFASEIKALIESKHISRELDIDAVNHYLAFGYIPRELCIFKTIRKLPPGHAMIYKVTSGEIDIWQYWEVPFMNKQFYSENELLEKLEILLMDAVKIRMISDVPIGAFLSGGLDSSLIVAMMSRVSDKQVKTFSIGFKDKAYNELPYARIISDYFGTDHQEIIVKPDTFSILPDLVSQFDEPFADSSMLPTYYISKATRDQVTVALSGDGGDEMFGGYEMYLYSNYYKYIRTIIPSFVRKGISHIAAYMPDKVKGKRQLVRAGCDLYDSIVELSNHQFFKENVRRQLLHKEILEELGDRVAVPELSRRQDLLTRNSDLINQITYADTKTYLPDDILVKVDRMSMKVSLEVRAPLLDYRIAEFSFRNIPGNMKVRGNSKKYLLKKLAKKVLPDTLDINRKWGFKVPISEWFRGPLSNTIKEILLNDKNDIFRRDYIERLLEQHMHGIEHSNRLYSLLVFCLWKKNLESS